MADLIDRQAVLRCIEQLNNCRAAKRKSLEYLRKCVENLPSAKPEPLSERETGRWVNDINGIWIKPMCNKCGYLTPYDRAIDDYEYGNYCPQCGRRMESEE